MGGGGGTPHGQREKPLRPPYDFRCGAPCLRRPHLRPLNAIPPNRSAPPSPIPRSAPSHTPTPPTPLPPPPKRPTPKVGPIASQEAQRDAHKPRRTASLTPQNRCFGTPEFKGHHRSAVTHREYPSAPGTCRARRGKSSHALVWPLEWGLRTPTLRCGRLSGPSRTRGGFFDFEVGGHDGAYKGRVRVVVPFVGRKNGKLFDCQQSYNVLVLRVRGGGDVWG